MGKIKRYSKALVLGVGGAALAGPAHAALTLPATLSMTDAETAAGLVVTFLAGIWVIKVAIGFFRGGK